jgi:tetratricopeptide (TPR) repeat protein
MLAGISSAGSIAFEREYTYRASEADSKLSCRRLALEEVKRLLLEELGTYLESQTEVKNYQLTRDQITTLTAGIVRAEIVAERWDGTRYWLKARIVADPDEVAKSIEALRKDHEKTKELQKIRQRAEQASREIALLKKKLAFLQGALDPKQRRLYDKAIKELEITDWFERGNAFYNSENYGEAIKAYSMVIKLDPDYAAAYRARGYAYYYDAQYESAMADFSRARELDPGDSAAYHAGLLATLKWYMHQWIVWAVIAAILIPLLSVLVRRRLKSRLNRKTLENLNMHLDKALSYGAPDISRMVKQNKQFDTAQSFTLDALSQGFYDWLKVDDRAADAIKFVTGQGHKGLEDIYLAASRATESAEAFDRLKDYVGQQIAAKDLTEQGFVVSFPDSLTNETYNLIVDGTPLQVKTTLEESQIRKALLMHPNISVLAPIELLDKPAATDKVIFSQNFSHQLAEHITHSSIEAIADLGMKVPLPILTIGLEHYTKTKGMYYGEDTLRSPLERSDEEKGANASTGIGGAVGVGLATSAAAAGVGSLVSWGSAATVGTTLAGAVGTNYGLLAGGSALMILGPLGAVVVASAGILGGRALGRILADWVAIKWKFRGHMDLIEPVIESGHHCRHLLSDGLQDRSVAFRKKRNKILSQVIVPDNKRADTLIKNKLRIYFDQDETDIQTKLKNASANTELDLKNMKPPQRVKKTLEVIESTGDFIKDNPIVSKDLAKMTKEFLSSADAFYSFLKERNIIGER